MQPIALSNRVFMGCFRVRAHVRPWVTIGPINPGNGKTRIAKAEMALLKKTGQGTRCQAPNIASIAASSNTATPRSCALASLLPASAPATTKSVFLLTEPATFAPAASSMSFA